MNKNERIIKFLKALTLVSLCIIIFLIALALGKSQGCNAFEIPLTTKECEEAIIVNSKKIKQCEEIKEYLHATAQAIRQQGDYDKIFVESLSAEWHDQNEYQIELKSLNYQLNSKLEELKLSKQIYIGNFTITHYCIENYHHICNNGNASITATGTVPTPGLTIAVDPKKIPYGTKVIVDGHVYIAEDTGGAIKNNKLDICVATHSEAIQKGVRRNVPVYIIKE